MKKFRISLFLLCIMILVSLKADLNIVTVEVKGVGNTRKEAINEALTDAMSQVKGCKINSETEFDRSSSEKVLDNEISSNLSIKTKGHFLSSTKGIVKNFDIIKISKNEFGYEAHLSVSVNDYKAPGHSATKRRTVVIFPFKYDKKYYNVFGDKVSGAKIANQYTQNLVTELTQTRKFAILDRTHIDAYAKEKNIILSDDASLQEQAKLGGVLGADYLIVGKIRKIHCLITKEFIQITGTYAENTLAEFAVEYQIITMATRQVKWSDTVELSKYNLTNEDFVKYGNFLPDVLSHKSANKLISNLVENIYPVRIIKVKAGGQMILNQGGRSMNRGDFFEIYSKGELLIDPYTGESLGSDETLMGQIQIIKVMPKISIGKIISGEIKDLKVGDICRRVK